MTHYAYYLTGLVGDALHSCYCLNRILTCVYKVYVYAHEMCIKMHIYYPWIQLKVYIHIQRTYSIVNHAPLADSPLNMTQSAPSSTALYTSVHSARVGRGFFCIDSNLQTYRRICVCVYTIRISGNSNGTAVQCK